MGHEFHSGEANRHSVTPAFPVSDGTFPQLEVRNRQARHCNSGTPMCQEILAENLEGARVCRISALTDFCAAGAQNEPLRASLTRVSEQQLFREAPAYAAI